MDDDDGSSSAHGEREYFVFDRPGGEGADGRDEGEDEDEEGPPAAEDEAGAEIGDEGGGGNLSDGDDDDDNDDAESSTDEDEDDTESSSDEDEDETESSSDEEPSREGFDILQQPILVLGDDSDLLRLIRDDREEFARQVKANTTVWELRVELQEMPPGEDTQAWSSFVAQTLAKLLRLRYLSFDVLCLGGYELLAAMLTHLRQITSLRLCVHNVRGMNPSSAAVIGRSVFAPLYLNEIDVIFRYDVPATNFFFPIELPVLSKLHSVKFNGPFRHSLVPLNFRTFCTSIQASPNIVRLDMEYFRLEGEDNLQLARMIASSPNLIHLSMPDVSSDSFELVCDAIRQHSSLKNLTLQLPEQKEACSTFSRTIQGNTCLATLRLQAPKTQGGKNQGMSVTTVLQGLAGSQSLKSLCICGYNYDNALGQGLKMLFGAPTALQDISINGEHGYTDAPWPEVFSCLANNRSSQLKHIHVNTAFLLKRRHIISCVSKLSENQTLESLTFRSRMSQAAQPASYHYAFSYKQGKALLRALHGNFSISTFPYELSSRRVEKEKEALEHKISIILKLNAHGRRNLVQNKSKERGVALLEAVSDDLDCIYFHLLENPSLCNSAKLDSKAEETRHKKRPRL